MLFAGVTGGIGAGKSTFVALLAERGAQVIDADLIGRDILKPDEPAWHSVVDQFGDEILVPASMEIDRKRLAEIVFNNRHKLAALNAITHPAIFSRIADDLDRLRNTDTVVILDAAIIVETGLHKNMDVLIAVVAEAEVRRQRLVRRGMSLRDIDARMSSQLDQQELESLADIVVRNDGDIETLTKEADRVWAELERLRVAAK
ncbi:MAG: dephospho-CoA kinase [Actinomycetota bacterium]|nr:dephospho-CoA kinase [Actinomycetota bacterium]